MTNSVSNRRCRIASYNIRKARGLNWRHDPERIVAVINGIGADVVVLQEADRRLGDRPAAIPKTLLATATDFDLVPLATNNVSLGWHGNAILVRKGMQATHINRINLPSLEPRGAVSVRLADGLTIVGVHLGLLRHSRGKQMKAIVRHLGRPENAIIIGDMNEWSRARGFEPLSNDFNLHTPGFSFHSSYPIATLDRVALSRDVTLLDSGVINDPLAKRASDHLPIWIDVSY